MRISILAAVLALAIPSYASDPAPETGEGLAVKGSAAPISYSLPANWTLQAIQVHTGGAAGAGYKAALKWMNAHQKAAAKAALAGSKVKKAAAPKTDLPTKEELDALDIELPFTNANKKELANRDHVILWDNSGKGTRASWHEPQWERQAAIIKKKLAAAGADPKRIHIYSVKKGEDFEKALKNHKGSKGVYVLGHAGPLALHFGDDKIDVAKKARDLATQKVEMICHYGCSFTNVDEKGFKPLQDNLPDGARITLYGHRTPSTKKDDDPFDAKNPIVRCEVDKDCATLFIPQKEREAMAAKVASRVIDSIDPWGITPQTDHLRKVASYNGQKPTKVVEPNPFDFLFAKGSNFLTDPSVGGRGLDWNFKGTRTQLPVALKAKKARTIPKPAMRVKKKPVPTYTAWIPSWMRDYLGIENN